MSVEVGIEIGHKAWKNIKPTIEGYTHDWSVLVRGVNGNEIKHIVEKVLFHLPDSYTDPLHIKEKPPFVVSESTARSFSMLIEVFFCAGAKLNKVSYIYDVTISDKAVSNSWERRLTFLNPIKDFKEKLLLAGGKVVDLEKFKGNAAFVKCKIEPAEEIEIIKDVDNDEALSSSDEKIDNLFELLKENEDLKIANAKVKEKTELQQKLINFYEKKMSAWETSILTSNMNINQLRKKIEEKEMDVSTLKLQVQILQKEFSVMKNPPTKNPEEKKRGIKRKNKENLNETTPPVEKKRGNVIQPTKVISFEPRNDSCTSSPSAPKNFSVSNKNQNINDTVEAKSSSSIAENSSLSKTDTMLINVPSDKSTENYSYAPPKIEVQPYVSEVRNDIEKPVENNSVAVNAAPKKCEINAVCVKQEFVSSLDVNSLYVPETTNDVKPMEVNTVLANASLIKPGIRNDGIDKPVRINSGEKLVRERSCKAIKPKTKNINHEKLACKRSKNSLCMSETRNDDVKCMEVNSVSVNICLNKPEVRNGDTEKPVKTNGGKLLKGSSTKTDVALCKSKTRNGVEKHVEKNSAEKRPEIGKGDIKELGNINDGEKPLEGSSTEVTLNESVTRNEENEKVVERSSDKVATPLNKSERKSDDAVKLINENSTEANTAMSKQCVESHNKSVVEELSDASVKEQNKSSIERKDTKSLSSNSKESGQKHSNLRDKFSSSILSKTKCPRKRKNQKPNNCYLEKFRNFQTENFSINSIWKEPPYSVNDSSAPNLVEFMTVHYPKLSTELDRIHNSKFSKLRHKTNPLFYKLGNINSGINQKYFTRYICSLTDFFTDRKSSFDLATIVYLVVDYLSSSEINHINLPTFIRNQDVYTILPESENCIVSALFEVEKKSFPHLHGLVRSVLNMIHRVIISKKRIPVSGLASLCRVFMDLCRLCIDRWQPLFLCCESLKSGHPFAPYLINMLAGIWRDPFYLEDQFSVEERMLLGSIFYGMNIKPLLMDSDLWRLTCRLSSTYFPFPVMVDPHEAVQFLTKKIISRCNEGLFKDLWMLTSPLMIFASNETWEWKICFKNKYILPNMLRFSRCFNERAFNLFCNLYVDICNFCHESPVEHLLQFFNNTALYEGATLVQDNAAIALLKYIGTTDKPVPGPLRNWFLRNKNNPKLAVIADLYCKKVMESQDAVLLWDDIIIL